MEANTQKTTQQKTIDWLSPTEALTRFRPPELNKADSTTVTTHAKTFFSFRVGNLRFLVAATIYCEVIEQLQVNPLPNVEAWFSGLLNLRGNLVPVIDLAALLNETVADNKKRHLFAIDQGEKAMALWIDELPEIHHTLEQPLKQLPVLPAFLQHCVVNGYLHKEQIWLHVKFDALFKALGRPYSTEETGL